MSAGLAGRDRGMLAALNGVYDDSCKLRAVAIPPEWLGANGDEPKAWDGWTESAHAYAAGWNAGFAQIVRDGHHGILKRK